MQISYNTPIAFNSLKMRQINGMNFPRDFQCHSANRKPYKVSVKNDYGAYQFNYSHKNVETPEADQEITLYSGQNYMTVDNMYTSTKCRNEGLGTCMHLTNIIELLENKLERIELFAVAEAVPFHSKLGFKPDDNWEMMISNIRCVAEDKTPELKKYSLAAKTLLQYRLNPQFRTNLANKLLHSYIKKALILKSKKEQKNMFTMAMPMTLTKKDIIKNKDFYNKLFTKYGIDYEI